MSEERLAARLLEGVRHLREGRPAIAARALAEVVTGLEGAEDLTDVRARAASLWAQALLETDELDAAREAVRIALRTLREVGDFEGLTEVRALDERIAAEKDRARRADLARTHHNRLVATDLEELLAQAGSALAEADVLIKRSSALVELGRGDEAIDPAERAVTAADYTGTSRERVLARLALARAAPDRAEALLCTALQIADQADETTLIGIVARAADLAGVALPRQYGPS